MMETQLTKKVRWVVCNWGSQVSFELSLHNEFASLVACINSVVRVYPLATKLILETVSEVQSNLIRKGDYKTDTCLIKNHLY